MENIYISVIKFQFGLSHMEVHSEGFFLTIKSCSTKDENISKYQYINTWILQIYKM